MVWAWNGERWCVHFHLVTQLASDWWLIGSGPCNVMLFVVSSVRAAVVASKAN